MVMMQILKQTYGHRQVTVMQQNFSQTIERKRKYVLLFLWWKFNYKTKLNI